MTTQGEQPSILLIDDDPISREVLATLLGMSGFSIQATESGDLAVELLSAGRYSPEVLLMDSQMPGLCGLPLIAALRRLCPVPIYLISGSEPPTELAAAVDGFLLKPFGPAEFQALLEEKASLAQTHEGCPESPAEDPAVDPQILAQLRTLMPASAIGEIFAALVADLHQRLASVEAAVAANDTAQLRRIGHAIKGGCGMAGAAQIARLGARIEAGEAEPYAGADSNHLDNNAPVLLDLRAAIARLERMLGEDFLTLN